MIEAVFLDLDGTLMDSKPGIIASLRHAFQTAGHAEVAAQDLNFMIGPPFSDSFAKLGLTNGSEVRAAYQERYVGGGGIFEADVYPGVVDMLQMLTEAGYRLYLMTAKPHIHARRVTAHFGLSAFLVEEFGPETDGTRERKEDLLRYALSQTGEQPQHSVLVGDRAHDVKAAAANGMPCIAAEWGYGNPDEWGSVAAVATHPMDVPDLIRGLHNA